MRGTSAGSSERIRHVQVRPRVFHPQFKEPVHFSRNNSQLRHSPSRGDHPLTAEQAAPHLIQSHPCRIPCSFLRCATSTAICYSSNVILSNTVCYVLPADHRTRPQAAIGFAHHFAIRPFRYIRCYLLPTAGYSSSILLSAFGRHFATSIAIRYFSKAISYFLLTDHCVHPVIALWPPFCHSSGTICYFANCRFTEPRFPTCCSLVHHTRPAFGFCYSLAIWQLMEPIHQSSHTICYSLLAIRHIPVLNVLPPSY